MECTGDEMFFTTYAARVIGLGYALKCQLEAIRPETPFSSDVAQVVAENVNKVKQYNTVIYI